MILMTGLLIFLMPNLNSSECFTSSVLQRNPDKVGSAGKSSLTPSTKREVA